MGNYSTIEVFNNSLDELREIFIWNRALSRLGGEDITNARDFLKEELFEIKGPYIEYVAKSALCKDDFDIFCEKQDIHTSVKKAYERTLFKGIRNRRLYKHQSGFVEEVFKNNNCDFTLSVPTASGKTEAFLLPILDECVKADNKDLKSLIFYPTKTLAVDQFNRIIRYVNEINNELPQNPITIGIWDGDTKYKVGSNEDRNTIKADSIIRGIKCPECGSKLRISFGEQIYCSECDFVSLWIKATRKAITTGVNILLTNPEAFDYLTIDPIEYKKKIIGKEMLNDNVKYVVFDEAHYWTGASGTAISLLCQRLRYFFGRDMKTFIVSATLKEPASFGEKITQRKNISISFEPEKIEYRGSKEVNIDRFPIIKPEEALKFYHKLVTEKKERITDVNFIQKNKNKFSLLEILSLCNFNTDKQKIILNINKNAPDLSYEEFMSSPWLKNLFRKNVEMNIPVIINLRDILSSYDEKPIKFTLLDDLIKQFDKQIGFPSSFSLEDKTTLLLSLLTIGRIAGLLQDRLHYFIRGNDGIYYCDNCKSITSKKICPKCNNNIDKQLVFCSTCHNIFYTSHFFLEEETDTSLRYDFKTDEPVSKDCPRCGSGLNRFYQTKDGTIYHPQLLSQFLSVYGRKVPSKKVLIFADSRNLAERIGHDFVSNDYQISTQRKMVELLEEPLLSYDLWGKAIQFVDKKYYKPILDSLRDYASRKQWKEFRESELKHLPNLNSATILFDGSLITAECILTESENDIQAIIGHTILKRLLKGGKFSRHKVKFDGFTLEKIREFNLKIKRHILDKELPYVIKYLYENNVITFIKRTIINTNIESNAHEKDRAPLKDYFEIQTKSLQELFDPIEFQIPKDCYGIITTRYKGEGKIKAKKHDFTLKKVSKVNLCEVCKKAFPAINFLTKICPLCKGEFISGNRSKNGGFLGQKTPANVVNDYWAKQINATTEAENTLAINVHRAGIPLELRSVIEDNFKSTKPDVNAISATTTFELGIDIGDLDTIFLVGLPPGIANYIQRAGRAGRSGGKSSIIVTFIKAGNAIDDYYFDRLEERYFDSIPKIGIPEKEDVEVVYASHIITLIATYLARNYDLKDIYKKIWDTPFANVSLRKFISQNQIRVKAFTKLIEDKKMKEIEQTISECFGDTAKNLLLRILDKNNDYSILKRTNNFFSYYAKMRGLSKSSQNKLAEDYRFFSNILNKIGYLANYRGFVQNIPIKMKNEIFDEKSILDAIKENYPGYMNNNYEKTGRRYSGGSQLISMTPYITNKVYASKKILQTKICDNKECDFYQLKAEKHLDKCVLCDNELTELNVYAPESIEIKRLPSNLGYKSSPFIIEDISYEKPQKEELKIGNNISSSKFVSTANLVTFVPSFSYRFRASSDWTDSPSQAEIHEDIASETLEEELEPEEDLDNLLEALEGGTKQLKRTYVPVGTNVYTKSFTFDFPINEIINKPKEERDATDKRKLAIFESTFEQALKKSISVILGCDLNDFTIVSTHTKKSIRLSIVDNCEGGNGIADSVNKNIDEILANVNSVVNCDNCDKFCKRCVLIERTPVSIIKNDLLDRKVVKRVLEKTYYD